MVQAPQTLLFYVKDTAQASAQQVVFPLFSQMAALQAYIHSSGPPPVNIKWLISGQGQTALPSLTRILSEQPHLFQADGCILYTTKHEISKVIDQTEIILGRKGHLAVEILLQVAEQAIPISYGAIAPNAAWQLLWLLASVKNEHEEILLDGFYDSLLPAEDEVIEALSHLPDTSEELAASWGTAQLLLKLQGVQQHYACFLTPGCNITMLDSKPATQLQVENNETETSELYIPPQARARLDFCLLAGQDPYNIFTKLEPQLQSQTSYPLHCRLVAAQPPIYTSVNTPLVQQLIQILTNVYQHPPILLPHNSETAIYTLLARQLAAPTIGIAPPLLSKLSTEQASLQLAQNIKQSILFLASMRK
ncbi:hypothetical protein KDW_09720 [Dictyobacter vulcani]|uniref:Uncharacterized protein n=2 Tax=Dictyobacter vulcani TaxID=2607529 RepID=A0A5J4KKB1_9CHLR|nr:hypothetical protein KDW_09720 [Dictyobacter vulcani]